MNYIEAIMLFRQSIQKVDRDSLLKFIALTKDSTVLTEIFTHTSYSIFNNINIPNISSCRKSFQILQEEDSTNFSISNIYEKLQMFEVDNVAEDNNSTITCVLENELINELIRNNINLPQAIKSLLAIEDFLNENNLKMFVNYHKTDKDSIEKMLDELITNLTIITKQNSISTEIKNKLLEKINSITLVKDNITEIQKCSTVCEIMQLDLQKLQKEPIQSVLEKPKEKTLAELEQDFNNENQGFKLDYPSQFIRDFMSKIEKEENPHYNAQQKIVKKIIKLQEQDPSITFDNNPVLKDCIDKMKNNKLTGQDF